METAMKSFICIIATFIFIFSSAHSESEQLVKPALIKAKVYLNGAELMHLEKIDLPTGVSDIVVEGIADEIDPASVQAEISGSKVTVLSIGNLKNYIAEVEDTREIKKLKDSIVKLNELIDENNVDIESLSAELDMILANKNLSGKDRASTAQDIKELAAFYAERIPEIKKDIIKINKINDKIHTNIYNINMQISELLPSRKPKNQLRITVKTDARCSAELSLRYFSHTASWTPFYDIRARKESGPIKVDAKAFVRQHSGLSWDKIDLMLSSRALNSAKGLRKAYQLYVSFLDDRTFSTTSNTAVRAARIKVDGLDMNNNSNSADSGEIDGISPVATFAINQNSDLFVEFNAKEDYTIPSDNKDYTVVLGNYDLPASYEYYAAPKLSLDAYITAKVKDWSKNQLIAGKANIFYENTYIGQTFINPQVTDTILQISLGTDPSIVITRELRKDFSEDKFLSSDVERAFGFLNTIHNSKSEEISIVIEDMIPISKSEDIVVKTIDLTNGEINKETGIVKWTLNLPSKKKAEIKTIYSVRYPKHRQIINPY